MGAREHLVNVINISARLDEINEWIGACNDSLRTFYDGEIQLAMRAASLYEANLDRIRLDLL